VLVQNGIERSSKAHCAARTTIRNVRHVSVGAAEAYLTKYCLARNTRSAPQGEGVSRRLSFFPSSAEITYFTKMEQIVLEFHDAYYSASTETLFLATERFIKLKMS
jgi:hypothetical protein